MAKIGDAIFFKKGLKHLIEPITATVTFAPKQSQLTLHRSPIEIIYEVNKRF